MLGEVRIVLRKLNQHERTSTYSTTGCIFHTYLRYVTDTTNRERGRNLNLTSRIEKYKKRPIFFVELPMGNFQERGFRFKPGIIYIRAMVSGEQQSYQYDLCHGRSTAGGIAAAAAVNSSRSSLATRCEAKTHRPLARIIFFCQCLLLLLS